MTQIRLIFILSTLAIAACGRSPSAVAPPANPDVPPPPPASPPFPSAPRRSAPSALPDDAQIYQEENGMFALALPAGYAYESIPQGVTFWSADGGFRGEITYLEVEESQEAEEAPGETAETAAVPPSPVAELEAYLKQTIQAEVAEVTWQGTAEEQADGSLRLAWTGTNQEGEVLDALSFIEQHHDTRFILKLYGVGNTYSSYNDDARIIVGSYVVQKSSPVSPDEEMAN